MADDTEILKVSVDIGDAERNLDQLAAKAEAAANKISAAFANVKMPDIGGKVAEHGKKVHEHASGIAATIEGMTERIGGSLKTLGAGFGEGGRLLGEMSEGAVKGIGAIGLALASLGGGARTAAKEMATIGDSAEEAMARSVKAAERAKGSIGEALKGALMGGPGVLALAGITAAVGGGIGAAFFGGKEAKDLEEMSHAANETYEEFKKIAEAGLEIGIGPEKMAETLKTANNLIREGALQAREMAESFAAMQDRIQYIKDAIKEQAIARQEAEHSAADAAQDAQHNIQQAYHGSEQAAQGVVDAQQRYQDALEEYQRHGRPRTASEQRRYEEEHRRLALEAAQRGVKEANYAKGEADRAVGEAQHKAEDQERRAAEQQERMEVQSRRMPVMLERMMNHLAAMQRAVQQNPLFQAIGGEGFKMGDLPKIADELERMTKLEPNEKLVELLKHLEKMPEGQERKRAFEMLPAGSEFDRPGQIEKFRSEIGKAPERLMQPETFEKLVQSAENTTRRMQEASTAAAEVGKRFVGALDAAAASLTPMIEGIGKIGDGLGFAVDKAEAVGKSFSEWLKSLTEVDNKLDDINKKLAKTGGVQLGGAAPSSPETAQGNKAFFDKLGEFLKSILMLGATPAGAAELPPELRGKSGEQQQSVGSMDVKADTVKQSADEMNVNANTVTINADNVSVGGDGGGGGGGAPAPHAAPRGGGGGAEAPAEAPTHFGGQGEWTDAKVPSQEGGMADVSVYRPPSASEIRNRFLEKMRKYGVSSEAPIPGSVPATPGTGVRQAPYTFKQERQFQRAYAEWERNPVGPAPVIEDFYQHGGMISGPGTSTSDSVLARLSNGEYVVKASAVSRLGVGFMDAVNGLADGGLALSLPRFAGGGAAVDAGPAAALHPLHLHLPGGKEIAGLFANRSAGEELRREAVLAQASSTMGAKPSWLR